MSICPCTVGQPTAVGLDDTLFVRTGEFQDASCLVAFGCGDHEKLCFVGPGCFQDAWRRGVTIDGWHPPLAQCLDALPVQVNHHDWQALAF